NGFTGHLAAPAQRIGNTEELSGNQIGRKEKAPPQKRSRAAKSEEGNCRVSTWNTIRLGDFRESILTGKLDGVRKQNGRQKATAARTKAQGVKGNANLVDGRLSKMDTNRDCQNMTDLLHAVPRHGRRMPWPT